MRRTLLAITSLALVAGVTTGCSHPSKTVSTTGAADEHLQSVNQVLSPVTSSTSAAATAKATAAAKAAAKARSAGHSSPAASAAASSGGAGVDSGALASAMAAVMSPKPKSYLYVSPAGSDSSSGSSSTPFRTVQHAVDVANPGTAIRLKSGTYTGQVKIHTSGTASSPIWLTTAGDGPVTLNYTPRAISCSSSQPAPDRTIEVGNGADYWRIAGLTIRNGIYISGLQVNTAYSYITKNVNSGNWQARRDIPGRGSNDSSAARSAVSYVQSKIGRALDPSDGLQIVGNEITGRGIHAALARYGVISANQIHAIDCGTGPGVWLITLSDGWKITENHVYDVRASSYAHFMQEGIRLGTSSNYNTIQHNTVESLPGDGRGFNTDTDSSFNVIQNNLASDVATGFNEQMSGWGNVWQYNVTTGFRTYGFGFRLMDAKLTQPSMNSSSYLTVVRCNTASGSGKALGVGGIMEATFIGNRFSTAWISKNSQSYWSAKGNIYNGSSTPPSSTPKIADTASC